MRAPTAFGILRRAPGGVIGCRSEQLDFDAARGFGHVGFF